MYTVIGSTRNRTLRVIWTLEELGVEYEQLAVSPTSPEAVSATGTGKVPALKVGDQTYTDSVAIMTFLADRHGALTFPAGSTERLRMDGHLMFLLEEFDSLLWTAARHSFILPEDKRVPAVKEALKWEFQRSLSRLEDRIEGPFLMGETFTIADILAIHCLNWGFVAKFPPPTDALKAYAKQGRKRPAYIRALGDT